jgi:hypothetical protein
VPSSSYAGAFNIPAIGEGHKMRLHCAHLFEELQRIQGAGSKDGSNRLKDIPAELTAIYPQLRDVVVAEGMEAAISKLAPGHGH